MNKKHRLLLSVVVVAGLTGYLGFTSLSESSAQYLSVSEVKASTNSEKIVHVNGTIVAGTKNWDPINRTLSFDLTDDASTISVVYKGNLPGDFQEAVQAVVTGQYQGDVFQANKMLLKCPSKYSGEEKIEAK